MKRNRALWQHGTRSGAVAAALAVMVVLGVGFGARPASAHWADQAVAEVVLAEREAHVTLTFLTGLAAFADDDRSGHISPAELQAHRSDLEAFFSERITLSERLVGSGVDAVAGTLRIEPAAATELAPVLGAAPGTHSALLLVYTWPQPVKALLLRYDLFLPGVPTASCLATIVRGTDVWSVVFTPEHREASITLGRVSNLSQIYGFVALGVRHILSGYDHLLFLLSLLMVGAGLAALTKVVSAFTLAHSITLSLAVLGLVALPARWVESAIALSIVYVAGENLWRRTISTSRRWFVTFGFGLVHGLGFASVLQEMALPRAALAASLVGFNLGVELGQLIVVAGAFTALQLMKSWPQETALRRWVSAGTVAAGLLWFVQRAFFGA